MKVLFGVNVTENSKNDIADGENFIIRRVPESLIDDFLDNFEPDEKEEKKTKSEERKIKIFNTFAAFVLCLGILGIFHPFEDKALNMSVVLDIIGQRPLWFVVSAIFFVIGLVLLVKGKRMENAKYEQEEETEEEEIDMLDQKVYEFLGVPADATTVEVIHGNYKTVNSDAVFENKSLIGLGNSELKMFTKGDYLYMADIDALYEIKPDCVGTIQKYNGKISLLTWNKKTRYNEGEYKQYNIRRKGGLKYVLNTYYSFNFTVFGELYKMYFPPYELENVLKITHATFEN